MTQPPPEEQHPSAGRPPEHQTGGSTPVGPPPTDGPAPTGFPPPAPGGYGAPPQGYGPPPQQGYGPPPQQYTQPGYGQGPASPGFPPPGNQPGAYPPPQYGPPQQSAPQPGYGQPQPGYGQPQQGHPEQQQAYGRPQQGFPPPAPGGYGAPQHQGGSGSGGNSPSLPPIDISKVGTGDWVVLGLGALLLIFSFFGWWSVTATFFGETESDSVGAWNRFWWIGPLLILAVTVIRAVQLLTGLLVKEIKPLWLLYAAVVAVVFYLIALINIFSFDGGLGFDLSDLGGDSGFDAGPGFGIWASIVLVLAFVYFLALSLQSRGEKLPVAVPGPKL